ncbi:tRNA dihydrouridine synthase DusB [Aureimonas mangrovi]|uniref:tRNA dihydrouridine synthase DusB n=1 Tax=Aureimonas mangrovi TaxID=2758041 RepID=UPI00163D618D|nr:tRNA dihydrouridine synthase DusB [Aureimonas mangrovi]
MGRASRDARPSGFCVGSVQIRNRVLLAPLSGITDVPFRRLARRFGAGLVFSEMVASGELLRRSIESRRRAMADGEGVHAVQLAGREPRAMGEAARLLAGEGADLIDINFGCPAKKVVGGLSGSALMREPDLALRIIEATVAGAGDVPVSVKMRLGWDAASINAPFLARGAQEAGARMVTVHGRTREQFYEGEADWNAVARVREVIDIPLVINGDIAEFASVCLARSASGADAVMIGRGACGRPWLPGLAAGEISVDVLAGIDAGEFVAAHYDSMLSHYGEVAGLRHARKHLGWYLDRAASRMRSDATSARAALMRTADPAVVTASLLSLLGGLSLADLETAGAPAQKQAA